MKLTNNSNDMATVVETFIQEETQELIYNNEKLDEWNKYIDELGLQGQTKIVSKEKSPIPFLHMKKSLVNTFEELCPRKVKVEEFSITPIPLELLSLISLAKKENHFKKIEIWYDDKTPDPVVVGVNNEWYSYSYEDVPKSLQNKNYSSKEELISLIQQEDPSFNPKNKSLGWETNGTYYLIGKWGDVKRSFKELTDMAIERYIAKQGNTYRKLIKENTERLATIEEEAQERFN